MAFLKKSILLISFLAVLISCTDDELGDPTNVSSEDLKGTWTITELTQTGTVSTTISGVPLSTNFTSVGDNIDAQITINTNPNTISGSGSFDNVITVTILTQTITETFPIVLNDVLTAGNWQLDNGTMTISAGSESQDIVITEATSSSLKIEFEVEEDLNIDGNASTATSITRVTLTK